MVIFEQIRDKYICFSNQNRSKKSQKDGAGYFFRKKKFGTLSGGCTLEYLFGIGLVIFSILKIIVYIDVVVVHDEKLWACGKTKCTKILDFCFVIIVDSLVCLSFPLIGRKSLLAFWQCRLHGPNALSEVSRVNHWSCNRNRGPCWANNNRTSWDANLALW